MERNIKSSLNLELLVFDKILFERIGQKSEESVSFQFNVAFQRNIEEDKYRIIITLEGNKENEYHLEIVLQGVFSFDTQEVFDEATKLTLISQNAVAIMMPYLRSEVSLLTAQPGVDSIVMPPFNVAEMMKKDK